MFGGGSIGWATLDRNEDGSALGTKTDPNQERRRIQIRNEDGSALGTKTDPNQERRRIRIRNEDESARDTPGTKEDIYGVAQ